MSKNDTNKNAQELIELKNSLNSKIIQGDFYCLGQLIECDTNTARMRFHRYNKEAVEKMNSWINNREEFINKNLA